MSLYLPVKEVGGTVAIGICARCAMKFPLGELVKDPNNGLLVCKADKDLYDPYRLPAHRGENISLQHPRPDTPLE